jgi:prepilin-type N-terminal cleavage/methylation domain-containing protein
MPNRAHSRRDPQKGKNGFSTSKGFTLIEMMITLGVIAIIASLALPSYRSIIEKRQVTSGAEQFAAFFGVVKSHAVKRNHDIAMYPLADGDGWCMGFKEFNKNLSAGANNCSCIETEVSNANACRVDLNNDGNWQANELTVLRSTDLRKPEVITGISFMQGGLPTSNKFFVFDSVRGFLSVPDDTYADSMSLSFANGQYGLNIWIDRLGRTFICSDPSATTPVPGYDPC